MADRPLRVALVHPYSWPAVRRGGERYLHDLAWYLGDRGYDVTVITGRTGGLVDEVDGARVVRVPYLHHRTLGRVGVTSAETFGFGATAALARHRVDVVHALTPAAALAARLSGHRTVYTTLGHPTRAYLRARLGGLRLYRTAVRTAHRATALSESAARQVEDLTGRAPVVLPPGIRLDRFLPDLEPRRGPTRVLFVSDASEPDKGVDVLLAAFVGLLDRQPDARLVLAGPGDHRWALARLGRDAERVQAATDVVGLGTLAELPARYRDASVVVLPSAHEAFGLALVEALASGTPVVCGDAGGMREIVDDPGVGRRVPPGDVGALTEGLVAALALAAEPDTPARCTAHARRWGWTEVVGPAHEALYHEVTSETVATTRRAS